MNKCARPKQIKSFWIRLGRNNSAKQDKFQILNSKEKLRLLTSRFGVISIDEVIGEVAATAKVCNLTLITRNIVGFPMKDIEMLDPAKM